jgi:hypothetical protein
MQTIVQRIIGLVVVIAINGCVHATDSAELAGEWTFSVTESTQVVDDAVGGRLIFASKGEISVQSISVDWECAKGTGVVNGAGKFQLLPGGVLRATFASLSGPCKAPFGTEFLIATSYFCRKDCQKIYYFLGDPDDGKRVVFKRVNPTR